ncbi:uncharacterized protein MONOS_17148 [Monocercomonoides exilis]|uniref:uncharacterized protein n=1 Tax=Monocercomonoides exilis TaxID=2049356 RepID=UPI0035598443|nr:hypothetical protein MONOS_17148 [Monocercomonoides exilis]
MVLNQGKHGDAKEADASGFVCHEDYSGNWGDAETQDVIGQHDVVGEAHWVFGLEKKKMIHFQFNLIYLSSIRASSGNNRNLAKDIIELFEMMASDEARSTDDLIQGRAINSALSQTQKGKAEHDEVRSRNG